MERTWEEAWVTGSHALLDAVTSAQPPPSLPRTSAGNGDTHPGPLGNGSVSAAETHLPPARYLGMTSLATEAGNGSARRLSGAVPGGGPASPSHVRLPRLFPAEAPPPLPACGALGCSRRRPRPLQPGKLRTPGSGAPGTRRGRGGSGA